MYAAWEKWARQIGAFPLDTRNYGVRMDAYKKRINGSFDDNLGGWQVKKNPAVQASITIDNSGQLTGKNALKVAMLQPGDKPAALALTWNFKAAKGEKYRLTLNSKSRQATAFFLRLEKPNGAGPKVVDQKINASAEVSGTTVPAFEIPADGPYQLALYFGNMKAGDEVWIDDVELIAVK